MYLERTENKKQIKAKNEKKYQLLSKHNVYFFPSKGNNGVVCWPAIPWSPKNSLPESSSLKHREKEFLIYPAFASKLGTDISPSPRPKRPSGATPFR